MTATELKTLLNKHIAMTPLKGKIYLNEQFYNKAKYSSTEEEKNFRFVKGHLFYNGYELIKKL